jgi:hypothetical protein
MKKLILAFSAIVFSLNVLHAQQNVLPDFTNHISVNCPFDSSVQIETYAGWVAYQTLDDNWNGPVDSTRCLDLYDAANSYGTINLNQIDTSRRIFIKLDSAATAGLFLDSNAVYKGYINIGSSNGVEVDFSANCDSALCSYIITNIEIPDSTFTGFDQRVYQTDFDYYQRDYCFPTEYFSNGNRLNNYVIALKASGDTENGKLFFYYADLHKIDVNSGGQVQVIDSNADLDNYYGGLDDYYFYSQGWEFAYLFLHDTIYPAANNITYYDFYPQPNENMQHSLDVYFEFETTVHLQPFVSFRGGLVLGDSVLRHNINLYNDGADMCLGFMDVMMEDNNRFIYNSGNVDFGEHRTCLGFGKGASLNVSQGATFHYGSPGMGMLLVKTGGTINIEKNAELVIHNTLIMYEYANDPAPQQIYMTLNEGAKLTFAPGSRVVNMYSMDGTIKLNIFMKGGEVDLSGLSENDKQLVNLIYDEPLYPAEDNLILYNQPSHDVLRFSMVFENAFNFPLNVFDINGKLVKTLNFNAAKGIQFFEIPLNGMPAGVYTFEFMVDKPIAPGYTDYKFFRKKFLKI